MMHSSARLTQFISWFDNEGNAEEFAAEGQRTQNRAIEGVVQVLAPESFGLDIVQEAS